MKYSKARLSTTIITISADITIRNVVSGLHVGVGTLSIRRFMADSSYSSYCTWAMQSLSSI